MSVSTKRTQAQPRAPWMQFWGDDFMSSTLGWSAAERGSYLILLWASWQGDGLPADPERLFRLDPDIRQAWPLLEPKFPIAQDGRRRNPRQEAERIKAEKFLQGKAAAGRASAAARQQDGNTCSTAVATEHPTEVQHEGNHSLSLSLSLPKPESLPENKHLLNGDAVERDSVSGNSETGRRRLRMPEGALDRLWNLFPRRVGKARTLALLDRAIREYATEQDHDDLEDAVEVFREHIVRMAHQYRSTEQQFIPHPATWMHQKRYLDPVPEDTR